MIIGVPPGCANDTSTGRCCHIEPCRQAPLQTLAARVLGFLLDILLAGTGAPETVSAVRVRSIRLLVVAGVLLGVAVFDRLLGMWLLHVKLLIAGLLNEPAARWFTGGQPLTRQSMAEPDVCETR